MFRNPFERALTNYGTTFTRSGNLKNKIKIKKERQTKTQCAVKPEKTGSASHFSQIPVWREQSSFW